MHQAKQIMDRMDAQGRGLAPGQGKIDPGAEPPARSLAERKAIKRERKAAFMDRLYGPVPETVTSGR